MDDQIVVSPKFSIIELGMSFYSFECLEFLTHISPGVQGFSLLEKIDKQN